MRDTNYNYCFRNGDVNRATCSAALASCSFARFLTATHKPDCALKFEASCLLLHPLASVPHENR